MPILKIPEEADSLSQGDVLSGLRLYVTANNWSDADEPGGSAEWLHLHSLCMVVSRPCVTVHKAQIIVAAIGVIKDPVPEDVKTFDEVRSFLEQLRDGFRRPDRFYLGQIRGQPSGRYYAHLDSLHTVTQPIPEVGTFLQTHRIATLTDDFRRDLHLRFFSAFANLGFDDQGWYSDEDLHWLVQAGQRELHQLKADLAEKKAELANVAASGSAKNPKHLESMQNTIKNLEAHVAKLADKVDKFESTASRRGKITE